ncbi:MAG: glycosyltransferase family 2 protein [Methylobacterium sp.]|nr:glycosyltransferase family 2 protein [Methylobacterium sp.]MCA3604561.1 glycosyltransferase family 2 protein [Methylobacterium sp.]MCA3614008.1 glycosyltransferase family 2 protein [Methylobacterium sp.]
MSRISIGMPCYGRPKDLRNALEHFENQTFRDFRIILHENPSDSTMIAELVAEFSARGLAIEYRRHPEQIGVVRNFLSVLHAARTEYFMWAADDDLRHPEAVEILYGMLERDPGLSLAASSVELLNLSNQTIDWHLGFSRFSTQGSTKEATLQFLAEPELGGKANLIYGLFRRQDLLHALDVVGGTFPDCQGQDLVVLAAFLSRFRIAATDRVLFRKKTGSHRTRPLAKRYPQDFGFNFGQYRSFSRGLRQATLETGMADDVERVIRRRLLHQMTLGSLRRAILRALGKEGATPVPPSAELAWSFVDQPLVNR